MIGASGLQGGGLISSLRRNPHFLLRLLTRSSTHQWQEDHKSELQPIEVVTGDMYEVGTIRKLFRGVWGAFIVTFSDFEDNKELSVGKTIAGIAQESGVQHLVFSSGIRTGVPFMDVKADIEAYIRTLVLPHTLYLQSGFFYENYVIKGGKSRIVCKWEETAGVGDAKIEGSNSTAGTGALGAQTVTFSSFMPSHIRVAMHAASDIGRLAALSLASPSRFSHEAAVRVVGDYLNGDEFAQIFTEVAREMGVAMRGIYHAVPLEMREKLVIEYEDVCAHY